LARAPGRASWEQSEPASWGPAPNIELALLQQLGLWPRARHGQSPLGWRAQAACRDLPTDLFFPVGHGPRAQTQARLAKQVCADCQVREDCLDYALGTNARYGVFGGVDEEERRQLRRHLDGTFGFEGDDIDADGLKADLEESA